MGVMEKLSILLVLLLVLPIVTAQSFVTSAEPIKDRISVYGQASYYLKITNIANTDDDYELSFRDVGLWDSFYTEPLSAYYSGITGVKSQETRSTKVILKPILGIGVGFHEVKIDVKSTRTGQTQTVNVPIYIQSQNDELEFLPHVQIGIDFPSIIDPRVFQKLGIVLENRNRKEIIGAELIATSNLFELREIVDLAPLERKEFNFPLQFDRFQLPQSDRLKVLVKVDSYTFEPDPINFEILDYSGEFVVTDETAKSFLYADTTRMITNNGNRERSQIILEKTSLIGDLFKSSEPDPNNIVKKDGTRYRAWEISLRPGQSTVITLTANYRILLYVLLLGILVYVLYHFFKSPVQITKVAQNIEMREGGISEVKIMLNVKNISHHTLDNVEVHDTIPNMANITNEFEMGTIRPDRVLRHEGRGNTVVEWKLHELDPHEDRVITYRIKSRLPVLGQFHLSNAEIKFQHKKGGKRHKVKSNRLKIGQ